MRNVDIFFTRTNAKGQTELAVKEGFHVRTRQFPEQGQLMCAYSGFFMRCPRERELHEATLEDACKAARPFPMHKAPNGESCINVEKNEHEEFNNEPMYHGEYTFVDNTLRHNFQSFTPEHWVDWIKEKAEKNEAHRFFSVELDDKECVVYKIHLGSVGTDAEDDRKIQEEVIADHFYWKTCSDIRSETFSQLKQLQHIKVCPLSIIEL